MLYEIVTLEEVERQISDSKLLAFDTETDGFYGPVQLAQFYQDGWKKVLLVHKPNPYQIQTLLNKVTFIAHNVHYDITTLQQNASQSWIPPSFHCSFFLSRLFFYHKHKFSLDEVLKYTLGYDPYLQVSINKSALQKADWSGALTEEHYLYAAIDVFHLLEVFEKTKSMVDDFCYKLDILFTKECLDFQWNGMPVSTDAVNKRFEANLELVDRMNLPINVNSYQQVRPYIGSDDSDALGLTRLKLQGNTKAGNVLAVRKAIKQNSFLKKFDVTSGRIYGKFLPSARSGRCTSKDQNLQQIPRDTKDVFETDEDKLFVYADYSQLELRGGCCITGEHRMEKLYREGIDLHGFTTEHTIKKDYNDRERFVGKTENFNLLYYGSANMLQSILIKDAEIYVPLETVNEYRKKWLKLWPNIHAWQQRGVAAWRRQQPWQTPLGRRYVGKLMTDQLNIQVQGFGSEVSKLATHYMNKEFDGLTHSEFQLDNFIHDSWIWEIDNNLELAKYVADTMAKCMQEAWFECIRATKIVDLPMPVDVYVGRNWGKIEKEYIVKYEYA